MIIIGRWWLSDVCHHRRATGPVLMLERFTQLVPVSNKLPAGGDIEEARTCTW
jgi:hypothetical protein